MRLLCRLDSEDYGAKPVAQSDLDEPIRLHRMVPCPQTIFHANDQRRRRGRCT